MAAITSNGIGGGNWSAGASWADGAAPVAGDTVTIAATDTITVDDTSRACSTIALNGKLSASRTANCQLAYSGTITINSTGDFDWGTEASPIPAAYTATLKPSANIGIIYNSSSFGGRMTMRGDSSRVHKGYLASTANAAATTMTVDAATGWQPGDTILFAPASSSATNADHVEERTLDASYTPGSTSLVITAGLTYQHISGGLVWNMTRNCILDPASGNSDSIRVQTDATVNTPGSSYFRWCRFNNFGNNLARGGFQLVVHGNNISTLAHVAGSAIADMTGIVIKNSTHPAPMFFALNSGGGNRHAFTVSDSLLYDALAINTGGVLLASVGPLITFDDCFFVAEGNLAGDYAQTPQTLRIRNSWISGRGEYNNILFDDITGFGAWIKNTTFSGRITAVTYNNPIGTLVLDGSDIGSSFGLYTSFGIHSNNAGAGGQVAVIANGTKWGSALASTYASQRFISYNSEAYAELWNKDGNTAVQEYYVPGSKFERDTTTIKNSTSSIKASITNTVGYAQPLSFQVLTKSGEAQTIKGWLRKNTSYGSSSRPMISASFAGVVLDSYTMTDVNDTWEEAEITFTQSSGTDALVDITFTVQSTSTSAVAYLSGLAISPFVTRQRHYGYLFYETTPTLTADPYTVAAEATALAYTGITITGSSTRTIEFGAGTADTADKFYDYSRAWCVADVSREVPFTRAGSLFDLDPDWMVIDPPYTDTSAWGTGTVKLTSTGAKTLSISDATIQLAATGDFNFAASTLSGDIYFETDTGSRTVTVTVPAGTSYTTEGANITVTEPTVERGIEFTGLIASSTVKVFETGTQTELFSDSGAATSKTWSEEVTGSITVDYTILKDGYTPIRVAGVTVTAATSGGVVTVPIQQVVDRAYVASTGLTFGTNCFAAPGTKLLGLTTDSTLQNFYSRMIESWVTEATLQNKAFPLVANGPNSFSLLDGWEWDLTTYAASITNLSLDGMRYLNASGVATAIWSAILTVGVPSGLQTKYQQVDGSGTTNADGTGEMDELVQVYGDATHGNFDKRGHLVLKVQEDGYDQAEFDAVATYGTLEDQLYVAGLAPMPNGIAAQSGITGITLTDHGAAPVTWNGKIFSLTITDTTGHTGEDILQYFRDLGNFNYHDLVQVNGTSYKTVRGKVYGDTGAAIKGVRVVQSDGTTAHIDFNLFTADDGTTYAPPVTANISVTSMPTAAGASRRLQLVNSSALMASVWQATTAYSVGDMVLRTAGTGYESIAGLFMRCTTAGTSGGTQPTWNTTPGGTTADGTVTWTTYKIMHYDADPASASYTDSYTDGEEFLTGETVRLRFAEMDTGKSFKTYSTETIVAESGFSVLVAEEADEVYATYGLTGSAYESTFSPDYTASYVVLDTNTDFSGKSAYAYFCYTLTLDQGMHLFWGGVTGIDLGNLRIESDVLNLFFDETLGFVKQTDDVRIYRKDGVRPALDPTTGGHGIEMNWRTPVSVVSTGGSALTPTEAAHLLSLGVPADNATAVWTDPKALTVPKFIGLK